ncbi:hypothetical protein J7E29_00015 [Streptomyces sp. ISL-90]|nr:hypothetical protein [Streptomyces sp. ISL-90]
MAKNLTPLHSGLAVTVWQLAERRAALAKQLAEADELHRQAVALAGAYGVPQALLSTLSDISQPRISQIIASTETPTETPEAFDHRVFKVMEWPQDQLGRLSRKSPAEREAWNRKYELVHGKPGNLGAEPDN